MSFCEWVYHIIIEGIKYIIIGHYFFGFEYSQKKTRYLPILYVLSIPVVQILIKSAGMPHGIFWFKNAWGIILVVCIMQGKLTEKVRSFFLMWFFITMVDVMVFFLTLMFTIQTEPSIYIKMIMGCMGALFWIALAYRAKSFQKKCQLLFQEMSTSEYFLLIFILVIVSLALGGVQSYCYGTITHDQKDIVFILVVIVAVIFIIICILLFYTRQSKAHLEKLHNADMSYLALQHQHYKNSLMQYEDMKSLQHDINKHIFVLSEFCRNDKIDDLKSYVEEIAASYDSVRTVQTGNFLADSIISYSLGKLSSERNFKFQMDGYFPEQFFMEDVDFCVLLSNLLENAREALEKVIGMRLIQMEVKRFREKLYLIVSNSVPEGKIDFNCTSKTDAVHHGYGIQNVRRVVEKYNGTVQWKQEQGMAVVTIIFRQEGDDFRKNPN
ncbi:MAG: GHKL domain-containing protein [Lachnospiraceae bacterium]|nr:GHKL domain-containing protein [Lachnospiraceae bacterium]